MGVMPQALVDLTPAELLALIEYAEAKRQALRKR